MNASQTDLNAKLLKPVEITAIHINSNFGFYDKNYKVNLLKYFATSRINLLKLPFLPLNQLLPILPRLFHQIKRMKLYSSRMINQTVISFKI